MSLAADVSLDRLKHQARLVELIGNQAWAAVRQSFPGPRFDEWIERLSSLLDSGLGAGAVLSFARASPVIAKQLDPEASLAVVPAALLLGMLAGARAAGELLAAAPRVARRADGSAEFIEFLTLIEELGRQAPESVAIVLGRIDFILSSLSIDGFGRWLLAGLRLHPTDAAERLKYFSLADGETLRIFDQEAGAILFGDIERRLRAFLTTLWGLTPVVRPAVRRSALHPTRRTSFNRFMVRMPETFPGFSGQEAERVFKASIAHVGAHLVFTERFQALSLKPIQIALVSLIEDARVEHLALRELPGLARLWRPFHVAVPEGGQLALPLMARLSRALTDPEYVDDNPWVNKGRQMFFDNRSDWEDQGISRSIGGLLGNDFGQMRVQFNPRTYLVQPAYRDDNHGIWNFGDAQSDQSVEAEAIFESVRIERADQETDPHHRQKAEEDQGRANRVGRIIAVDDDAGIPVARYPEWDHLLGRERLEWTTVLEYEPRRATQATVTRIYDEYAGVLDRVTRLVRSARVSRPVRLRRQPEGDRLDIEACVRAAIDRRTGSMPDAKVYETSELRNRDLSILLLLDISESTKDYVAGSATSVFELERAAAALMAEAMTAAGDPFAVHAFCSNGRNDVRYYRVKDFISPFGNQAKLRLAGLRGGYSTRMGAAIRHAGSDLARQLTHRRLLLIVTDGEPSDVDVPDRKYLVEDARKAVQQLAHQGIDVFCVGLDSTIDSYLHRIFGRRNLLLIDRITALPEKLPMLYFRLTH